MTQRQLKAKQTFTGGFNCAQAVISAFEDILNVKMEDITAVAAGFGGGMGRLQLTCGAVTGACMVLGIHASMYTRDNQLAKGSAAGLVREFEQKFSAVHNTTSCREILGIDMNTGEGQAIAKEKDLFGTVCVSAVTTATGVLEEMLLG